MISVKMITDEKISKKRVDRFGLYKNARPFTEEDDEHNEF